MSKNIKSQFHNAINNCFQEGIDKDSYKEQNGRQMTEKIFGYDSKFNALDVARNFSNYLKENNPDIRLVRDITPEHIQGFLNYRSSTCQDSALKTYSEMINKLELAVEKTYKVDLEWKGNYVVPVSTKEEITSHRGVDSVIDRTDLNTIVKYAEENRSQSGDCIRLQEHLGIRINEMISIKLENIDLDKGTILLDNCKGGKDLERELSPRAVEVVKDIMSQNYSSDTLFNVRGASVNEYLRDFQDRNGMERHSFHDIRRCIAQEKYDSFREDGCSIKDAADKTSEWLNHGKDREAMLKESYIVLR